MRPLSAENPTFGGQGQLRRGEVEALSLPWGVLREENPEIFASPSFVGRSFAAPPGLPKERIEELRTAFMAMVKDPDFLAEVAKLNFDLDPLSGADLQGFFVKAEYAPALIDKAKAVAKLAEH